VSGARLNGLVLSRADVDFHEVLNLCCEETRKVKLIFAREGVQFHRAPGDIVASSKLLLAIDTSLNHAIQKVVKDMVDKFSA
jgi:hypothetical protein